MKRTMFLIAVLLAVTVSSLWTQTTFIQSNGYEYKETRNSDNTITIYMSGEYKGDLIIPSSLYGIKVTGIAKNGFMNYFGMIKLTSVVIPNTITFIGESAFFAQDKIKELTIPASVKRIDAEAFYSTKISKLVIPASLSPGTNGQLGNSSKGAFDGKYYEEKTGFIIILPAGMDGLVIKNNFGQSLANYYVNQGKAAGIYAKDGSTWSKITQQELTRRETAQKEAEKKANEPWTYASSGEANYKNGNYDQAIADYTQAIRLKPDYTYFYSDRAEVYMKKGDYDKAIADYTEAIRLHKKDEYLYQPYEKRAKAYMKKGDYDNAIADYTEAMQLSKFTYYCERAEAYMKKGDYNQAHADIDKELKRYPKSQEAKDLDAELKKLEEAARKEAARKAELDPNTHFNRGKTNYDKKDYDRAITDFTKAIQLDPDYVEAYKYRALAYYEKGNYDKVFADCNETIQRGNSTIKTSAYVIRANTYVKIGDYDKAIDDCTEVIQLNPNYADAYTSRAVAYGKRNKKGDVDKVIADCDEAIRINSNSASSYAERGWAYFQKRKYKEARADANAALRLDSKFQRAKDLDEELKKKKK